MVLINLCYCYDNKYDKNCCAPYSPASLRSPIDRIDPRGTAINSGGKALLAHQSRILSQVSRDHAFSEYSQSYTAQVSDDCAAPFAFNLTLVFLSHPTSYALTTPGKSHLMYQAQTSVNKGNCCAPFHSPHLDRMGAETDQRDRAGRTRMHLAPDHDFERTFAEPAVSQLN